MLIGYATDSSLSRPTDIRHSEVNGPMMRTAQNVETRSDRRKRRNRQALIQTGYEVMARKGIDAATMYEICELADVGVGTVYNYFSSKDELAMYVMELVMDRLAQRIEAVTNTFTDCASLRIRDVQCHEGCDHRSALALVAPSLGGHLRRDVSCHGPICDQGYSQSGRRGALPHRRPGAGMASSDTRDCRFQFGRLRQGHIARQNGRSSGEFAGAWSGLIATKPGK
jgi:AcrR family transcriptional regulator